jgi:hypothetical protein
MSAGQLWSDIGEFFHTDDGALYDIDLDDLPPLATQHVFNVLASRAESFRGSAWHKAEARSFDVHDLLNAPELVDEGYVEPCHMLFAGVRVSGEIVPDLGGYFFQRAVELDYRMGTEWNAQVLAAFIDLLDLLVSPFPGVLPSLQGSPEANERFQIAMAKYLKNRPR